MNDIDVYIMCTNNKFKSKVVEALFLHLLEEMTERRFVQGRDMPIIRVISGSIMGKPLGCVDSVVSKVLPVLFPAYNLTAPKHLESHIIWDIIEDPMTIGVCLDTPTINKIKQAADFGGKEIEGILYEYPNGMELSFSNALSLAESIVFAKDAVQDILVNIVYTWEKEMWGEGAE